MARSQRLALSLKPEIYEVIKKLSKLNGMTKTSVIHTILKDMYPHLKVLADTLEKAKTASPEESLKTLTSMMEQAHQVINKAQLSLKGLEQEINEPK